MVALHGIKLAVDLINAHFGELVAKVCSCLLHKGPLALQDLARSTELTPTQLKNSLLVLIQHNCVQGFKTQKPGGVGNIPKITTEYVALFDNILHRLRFPKFLMLIRNQFDEKCEALLEGLLEHGRLTLQQIILRAMAKEGNTDNQDNLRASFAKLVQKHYVERCPTSEPFLMPSSDSPQKKRPRGPKSAKEVETEEELAIKAAAPSYAQRFSLPGYIGGDAPSEAGSSDNLHDITVGEKRKHVGLDMDDQTMASTNGEVLWRANFEEFVRSLRHKACIANVRSRLDLGVGIVLEAILEATKSLEEKVKTEKSALLPFAGISEAMTNSPDGRTMTSTHIRAALDQLCSKSFATMKVGAFYSPVAGDKEESYSIGLREIIEVAQNDEVEAIVLRRYGKETYRIFRLLIEKGLPVETKQISEKALIETKAATEILFKLLKDEYVHMEQMVVRGQVPLFLWRVNKSSLWEHVLNDMYHSASNLCQRLAYELEQERELLELPQERVLTEVQDKKVQRIKQIRKILEASLLNLDDSLMLFHDF